MTPANIAGMAMIKGLHVIAVTDHNSCKNCEAVCKAAEDYGILVIPGMELTTVEEVHVLCFFHTLHDALAFDTFVYEQLNRFPNHEGIFGRQLLMNAKDEILGTEPNLLIQSTRISFMQLYECMKHYDGVMVPAHINKSSHSVLSNLGFIPEDSQFGTVEVSSEKDMEGLKDTHPYLRQCQTIINSDAHYLHQIHEPKWYFEVEEVTIEQILNQLR